MGWFTQIKLSRVSRVPCFDERELSVSTHMHIECKPTTFNYWPWARLRLHSVGPHPSHASFIAWSYCPHLRGNSSYPVRGIVTLVPNEEEFPCRCGQEVQAMKEAWEGWGPTEWRCDLAQGQLLLHWYNLFFNNISNLKRDPNAPMVVLIEFPMQKLARVSRAPLFQQKESIPTHPSTHKGKLVTLRYC